ncbi:MAG: 4Fe-4S dicluster domain-containing protein, partial [Treponema sp.]|nr:4Fe-4S dicluster domain-containing protein [Treponema sp.]
MNNVTEKVSNKICTGCGACKNICKEKAVDAIEMRADNDGFYRPAAQGNCTGCGLCVKVCPAINPACDNETSPKCYAVMASDEIRMKSSSGGMFTLLADYIFEKGGYVCGAVFAEDFRSVYHAVTNDRRVFEKMRGSKYVQSDAGDSFFKIKTLLEQKEHVLFSGCPCQVAGLYAFLGRESR